jgi:hypothetical protein
MGYVEKESKKKQCVMQSVFTDFITQCKITADKLDSHMVKS